MFTISDILKDINRGCLANNMIEECFSYRIIFFVNENSIGRKYYVDTPYDSLRRSLENIIRGNLSTTNSIVISQTTTVKDGKCVCLQSKAYAFSLNGFFQQIVGEREKNNISNNCGRRKVNWC